MPDPAGTELIGGRYTIIRELGRGGSAVVYVATDQKLGGLVAVKALHEELSGSRSAERFLREIRLMADFGHSHILPILDSGQWTDRLFYVMKYVEESETLRERLRRHHSGLPLDDVLDIARGICAALSYAHARKVIHRDVKPENILLIGTHAYLTDFGVAKALEPPSGDVLTSSGFALGTQMYMSPEQESADPHVDGCTDIWSLACVLFEALTGMHPFHSPDPARMRSMKTSARPEALRRHRPNASAPLEGAIEKALAPNPADRWQSADEFARALGVRSPVPSAEVPINAAETNRTEQTSAGLLPARPGDRRRRRRSIAAGLAVAVVASALSFRFWPGQGDGGPTDRTPARNIVIRLESSNTPVHSPLGPAELSAGQSLRRYFEMIPSIRVEDGFATPTPAPAGTPPRYVARFRVASVAGGEMSLELDDAESGKALLRTFSDSLDAAAGTFWPLVALNVLRLLASSDSAFPPSYRLVLNASSSPRVVEQLLTGWRKLGSSDESGAEVNFRAALAVEPTSHLARARLAAVLVSRLDYARAYELTAPQVTPGSTIDAMASTVQGYHYFTARMTDSALAAFRRSVVDVPENVDGWFGLAQTLYFQGWTAGHSHADALGPFQRLVALDPEFSRVREQQFDAAMAAGETSAAGSALRDIPVNGRWKSAKEAIFALGTARSEDLHVQIETLRGVSSPIIAEIVLQLSRSLDKSGPAADVAQLLAGTGRTPHERLRGLQLRSALIPGDSGAGIAKTLESLVGSSEFEPWLAARCLALGCPVERVQALTNAANAMVVAAPDSVVMSHGSDASQAFDFLTQVGLVDPLARVPDELLQRARRLAAKAHPSDPLPGSWEATLRSVRALRAGDTTTARGSLRRAVQRIDSPFDAFFPLRANAVQRRTLDRLLNDDAANASERRRLSSSFGRSWSLADAMYAGRPNPAENARN